MKLITKLITKIRECVAIADSEPEIIEDMYVLANVSPNEIFHANLDIIVDQRGISYFDAFVAHIKEDSNIHFKDRLQFEHYLYHQGLGKEDVENLVEEFYRIEMPNNQVDS